jgi:four helix bundle protein
MRDLDHRQLDVYRVAIEFVAIADRMSSSLVGRAPLADQLRRASTSICLNIAEGAGEFSPKEKSRFYRIARRSAAECGAILDVMRAIGEGVPGDMDLGDDALLRIVRMLTRLVQRTEP